MNLLKYIEGIFNEIHKNRHRELFPNSRELQSDK